MRVGSVFAGIGGFDLAFERAGAEVIWNCEIDKHCRSVLQRHWPGIPRFKDVKTVTGQGLGAVGLRPDALVGGFPCQDLSVAGARAGLAGERSGLFFEFARILEETKPQWFLLENVPGLLSAGCKPPCVGGCVATHGGAMGAVLGTLVDIGYGVAWRVLDAQYFGVAQRRRRVFIVGCLGDGARAAEVLLVGEGGGGDPPARRTAGADIAGSTEAGAYQCHGNNVGPFGTLRGGNGHLTGGVPFLETVQGLTGSFGNGGADDNKAQAGWLIPTGTSTALTSRCGSTLDDHQTTQLQPVAFHMTQDPIAGSIAPAIGGVKPTTGYATVGVMGEISHAIPAHASRGGVQEDGTGRGIPVATVDLAVRRLTPLECLRLQGFPDDWLDGLGLADSTKYRMAGNAVAVPCVEWIARRLARAV